MIKAIAPLLAGVIFGFGLTLSQMSNPNAVLGFLDLFGDWDPRLLFVMTGGLAVTLATFTLVLKRNKPYFAKSFSLSTKQLIDRKLIVGSIIFGIGWGLSGYCPGPAIAGISINPQESIVFIIAMAIGIKLQSLIVR